MIELTLLQSTTGILTKRIWLSADGQVESDGGVCSMSGGTARRVYIKDIHELGKLLGSLESNQALALGALRDGLPEVVRITTKKKLNGATPPDTIARTAANFVYRPGQQSLIPLDYDTKQMPADVAARIDKLGGFETAITSVAPAAIATAPRLTRASTSAGLYRTDTGERMRGSNGRHMYLVVQDGSDTKRFLKDLQDRCWLAGLGWFYIGRAGQLIKRSIIDVSVGAAEHLVFEGPPLIESPLAQDQEVRRPVITDGEPLDTRAAVPPDTRAALLPLSADQEVKLQRLERSKRQHLAPEVERVKATYIETRTGVLMARRGLSERDARHAAEQETRGILLPHFELPFDDPDLAGKTVGDVLDDPERFIGERLADPLDDEGRPNRAMIMRGKNDGSLFIKSYAHGEVTYQLRRSILILDPQNPMPTARIFLERQYAGKRIVCHCQTFYEWCGSKYKMVNDDDITSVLWPFLEQAQSITKKDGLVPFKPTPAKVDSIIGAMRAETHIANELMPPCWIDGSDHGPIIACQNGLLRLHDKHLLPLSPDYFNTSAVEIDYDPEAPYPVEWANFLVTLWGHEDPDFESVVALRQQFGYVLSGDSRRHKMFLHVGPSRAGKGVITRILHRLLGGDSHASLILSSLTSSIFGLEPLIGKPLATVPDVRVSGRSNQIVEILLAISGGDDLTIHRKQKSAVTVRLPTRFWFLTNIVLKLFDGSGTIASRFIAIQYRHSFAGKEDLKLEDRCAKELAGILNWAIEGWDELERRGHFLQPKTGLSALRSLRLQSNPVIEFIEQRYVVDPESSEQIVTVELYNEYKEWFALSGQSGHAGSETSFGIKLAASFQIKKKMVSDQKDYCRRRWNVYVGLRLRTPDDAEPDMDEAEMKLAAD